MVIPWSREFNFHNREKLMVITSGTLLTIILVLLLIGCLPTWPHSKSWGYGPMGVLMTVLVIVLIMKLLGYHHI